MTNTMKTTSALTLLVKVVVTLLLVNHVESQWKESNFAHCGSCYCIVNASAGETCPEPPPITNYTKILPVLKTSKLVNPISINCNPFTDSSCKTTPPQDTGGACIVTLIPDSKPCSSGWSYNLTTYAGTIQEAQAAGLYVEHANPCGVCSSLQDVAVYMEEGPNLPNKTRICESRGLKNGMSAAVSCLEDLGFTTPCATLFYYALNNTHYVCQKECKTVKTDPTNYPPPSCNLTQCWECDDVNTQSIIKGIQGGTRRTSGLLSNLARPCDGLARINHTDPCTTAMSTSATKKDYVVGDRSPET